MSCDTIHLVNAEAELDKHFSAFWEDIKWFFSVNNRTDIIVTPASKILSDLTSETMDFPGSVWQPPECNILS